MEVFAIADAKTRDAKILQNGNVTAFFLTKFNMKLILKKFN